MRRFLRVIQKLRNQVHGAVFTEYLLLVTLVGIGVIAGIATLRVALLNELSELAAAIAAIKP
jgi:Flp pilus assembly pilin Flp